MGWVAAASVGIAWVGGGGVDFFGGQTIFPSLLRRTPHSIGQWRAVVLAQGGRGRAGVMEEADGITGGSGVVDLIVVVAR